MAVLEHIMARGQERLGGLKAFGCVCSSQSAKEKTTIEYRYFLTSLADATQFARSVRSHWG